METNKNQVASDGDTDNLDNPRDLKEMRDGFLDTIKEKDETINMYKNMVINRNLQLVQMNSAHQRKIRIQSLPKLKTGDQKKRGNNSSGEVAKDPLTLLPEEIWTIFLSQVTEVKDLLSLSRTCLLFQEILNKTKTQWLFAKTFPFLFNHLSRNDVLSSRLVCKQWAISVDNFLENYKLLPAYFPVALTEAQTEEDLQQPKLVLKSFQFEYNFCVPFTDLPLSAFNQSLDPNRIYYNNKNKFVEDMKLHHGNRNPFIGRSVAIEDISHEHSAQFVPNSKSILEVFGKHICHLTIDCRGGWHKPLDLWRVVNCGLEKCINLKTLRIAGSIHQRSIQGLFAASENTVNRPSLEAIRIDIYDECVHHLQDKLLSEFSGQLKRIDIQIWREGLYDSFYWGSLRELLIKEGNCKVIIPSLLKTEYMWNLTKLTITAGFFQNGKILKGLVELTRKFSKLRDLVIKFNDTVGETGTTLRKICDENLPPGVMGSKNLTGLEIHSDTYHTVTYDFLVYFPYLSRVTIKHCHKIEGWTNRGSGSSRRLPIEENGQIKNKEGKGFINIGKYLAKDLECTWGEYDLKGKIYGKSNIWNCLPFLDILTVFGGSLAEKNKKVFTRHGYNQFCNK